MMTPAEGRSIIQVLVLFDESNSREYGVALWAALHEVETFYRQSYTNVTFKRFYLSSYVPQPSWPDRWLFLGKLKGMWGGDARSALAMLSQESGTDIKVPSVYDKKSRNYDQGKLADQIPGLIQAGADDTNFVIITDRPITPPRDWRYVIWDSIEKTNYRAFVISAAPLDPHYWRDKDSDRVATIKNRVRAACLSVTGSLLNLERCENPACFMFDNVDSVTVLDDMAIVGAEHKCPALENKGFEEMPKDPNLIHPPVVRSDVS